MCTNGTSASRIVGNTEVETLGQLSPSNVDPPCAGDEHWPTTGTQKTGAASSAKEITEGEPKDQRKRLRMSCCPWPSGNFRSAGQRGSRRADKARLVVAHGPVLSSLVGKEAVTGV